MRRRRCGSESCRYVPAHEVVAGREPFAGSVRVSCRRGSRRCPSADLGLTSATDEVVLAQAVADERVLVSADTDFGTLLARSGADKPSVVLIRRAVGRRADQQARLLIDNLPQVQDDLQDGAVVVFGEKTIRIRRLPI